MLIEYIYPFLENNGIKYMDDMVQKFIKRLCNSKEEENLYFFKAGACKFPVNLEATSEN
jgi:hypothetical protein